MSGTPAEVAPMAVELLVTAGPHAGRAFQFAEHATFLVGRSTQAHFSLPDLDPHVSRLHAVVEVNPPLCRVMNLSAVNGTNVNGRRIDEVDLADGDRITIGRTEITVRLRPVADTATVSTVELLPPVNADTVTADSATDSALASDPPPDIPGYTVGRELGRGGMGVVYEGVHLATGGAVAIKVIPPRARVSAVALTKFLREADTLRRLDHPGIIAFRDSGVAGGRVWFAMELVRGSDARQVSDAAGPLPVERAVGWVRQVLEALTHAHGKGFVHRDVKPANLLVTTDADGREVVKLADFGLARTYEASPLSGLTMTGSGGGTPPFMPPEQVLDLRSVKPAADQYAAAATLYRLLSGHHVYPPAANPMEQMMRILQTDPTPLATHRPDLPPDLIAVIHRALVRDPAARFAECRAFAEALRPFAG